MSRVVRFNVTNRASSGTQIRRAWMLRCCQRLVLMFECETFCALSLRLPVMSLLAMARSDWGVVGAEKGQRVSKGAQIGGQGRRSQAPAAAAQAGAFWLATPRGVR